jgi:hypothetical protein
MATFATPMTAEIEGMDTVLKDQQQQQQQQQYQHGNDENNNNNNNDQHLTEAEKSMRDEELSFYSNSTNDYGDDNIWGLLSGIGGNIYEWYVHVFAVVIVIVESNRCEVGGGTKKYTRMTMFDTKKMLDSNSNSCVCNHVDKCRGPFFGTTDSVAVGALIVMPWKWMVPPHLPVPV